MARSLSVRIAAAAAGLAAVAAFGPAANAAGAHAHPGAHHHRHHHPHIVHRGNQAASSGDRHASHPVTVHKREFGAPVWEPPQILSPYPYSGKLAGDGILHTGWMDSNVMRAWGLVRN